VPGTAEALAAIRARDDELHAFITVRQEAAAEPGVPLAVKDLVDTAGVRTTYGSRIFSDHVPERSAPSVAALEAAGHAIVGKTNLHEFAYGITSENEHYGDVVNPLDPARIPGGSSGGNAAALVAGMCDVALGTDSGGSIRIPAACCGVVGFKPTHGLVPADGVFPLAPSFDHVGPMARTVAGCIEAMAALAPQIEQKQIPLASLKVGVAWLSLAEPGVRARVEQAAALFPEARPFVLPLPEHVSPAFMREAADVHRELFEERAADYGANVRAKIERCLAVTDDEYEAAEAARRAYRRDALEAARPFDLVLVPTLPFVAPPAGQDEIELRWSVIRLTFPFNALGWPALALPCGPAEDGLPASVSLIGRPGDDGLVLAAGLALERALSPV
jgi:aspartyl-tRNA(Asn)/glutamyl-tRNA(Gln) amidotransferase subunit A